MKKVILFIFLAVVFLKIQAQDYLVSFTGTGDTAVVSTVKVDNLTSGTTVTLNGGDILHLSFNVGINPHGVANSDMSVYPNPMNGQAILTFTAPENGVASISLFDGSGRNIYQGNAVLSPGNHSFRISGVSRGMYFVKVTGNSYNYSAKLISESNLPRNVAVEQVSSANLPADKPLKNTASIIDMQYTTGDRLLFKGISGRYSTVVTDVPASNKTITFSFARCTDNDGNNYPTVKIGEQIWMAENLNVGTRIDGNQEPENNGIIEKYCYENNENNCNVYGGLYKWDEMMQYSIIEGVRGICPSGWHLPTNGEWLTLTNFLGGESVAGGKVKETGFTHWLSPNTGATNSSGFTALPGGGMGYNGAFAYQTYVGYFWSSLGNDVVAWLQHVSNDYQGFYNTYWGKNFGSSVRCIRDNTEDLSKLTGDTSKTWKLLRSVATGRYPLQCGPEDHSVIWWAMGLNNNELANRPCMLNDEWKFYRDGTLQFDTRGDYWEEGGIFNPGWICASTDNMINSNGIDCSAWGSGTHNFTLNSGSSPKITSVGNGAYIGFYKLGNNQEVTSPQDSVRYNIVKLTDGPVDTLVVEGVYRPGEPTGGYWRFVLMHYDNPNEEPPIPGNLPQAGFFTQINGLTVTFINTSSYADTYLWDFGDGQTSTEVNPVHTYATGGPYNISLTATNGSGTSMANSMLFLSTTVLTNAILQGAAWNVRAEDKSVFVGPGMGNSDWWSVPKEFFISGTGAENWTCMPDDEFTFSTGGVFTYITMGSARNDGYMGSPQGCWTDAEIAASGNGAAFGSATHSYSFTPASGGNRPIITLLNGEGFAAFIGFYKGYYGGENVDPFSPPNGGSPTNRYEVMGYANNGTKEYLFVSVDISANHDGSVAWSAILER